MRNARTSAGDRRRVILGVLAFLAGMALLVTGVATQLVPVGVLGFVAMLGGIWLVVLAMRPKPEQAEGAQPGAPAGPRPVAGQGPTARPQRRARAPRPSGSLTERMEERWRRRRERGDF
jgi:hypothetical protein